MARKWKDPEDRQSESSLGGGRRVSGQKGRADEVSTERGRGWRIKGKTRHQGWETRGDVLCLVSVLNTIVLSLFFQARWSIGGWWGPQDRGCSPFI